MKPEAKELKLIAFDLDGTFLDDQKEIPEENLKAVRAAADLGCRTLWCRSGSS